MVGLITVRPLEEAHLDQVVVLEQAIYDTPWSRRVFEDELRQPGRTYLAAVETDGRLVGYGGMMVVGDEAHITTIAVSEAERGNGLGTRLMMRLANAAVDAGAKHLTLEVRSSNLPAQALYRRFGMAPVGVRKDYYITEDALIMWVTDIDGEEYRQRLDSIGKELDG